MAPILLEHTSSPDTFKSNYICSDPSVVPSNKASKRTRELWWLHGSPHSKRYSNPKLVSLAALVRHSSHVYKDQTAFLYPASTEATTPYNSMSWHKFDSVTEAIALTYAYQLRKEIQNGNRTRTQPTVALLGSGTTLEYFCTELALQKLGLKVLLLAESNASNTLHFLLESCHVLAVITDSKNANVDTKGIRKVHMIELMPSDSHVDYCEVDEVKFQDFGDIWERHTFIMHSSGSTGMPKPIIHTNRSMMLIARMYRLFQEFNIDNWFLLFPLLVTPLNCILIADNLDTMLLEYLLHCLRYLLVKYSRFHHSHGHQLHQKSSPLGKHYLPWVILLTAFTVLLRLSKTCTIIF
jgi:acyl-CoA synthetase (AMP-forming)/AMP-acid ligase II